MTAIQNIYYLYFKDYYEDIDFSYVLKDSKGKSQNEAAIAAKNARIKQSKLVEIKRENLPVNIWFQKTVAYPGLVTGIGIVHDSKKLTGGYNLGMHFNYTYGMPNIYGSSVKGVLRNYFKQARVRKVQPDGTETISYDDDLFTPISRRGFNIEELFEDIFNGRTLKKNSEGKQVFVSKSIYKRDIFFDAVVVKAYKDKYLVADDSITPHKEGPLKDPIPITMLKIAPGCTIEFRFHLNDFISYKGDVFKAEEKKKLFMDILKIVGIGAKTNVGYGQLEELQEPKKDK